MEYELVDQFDLTKRELTKLAHVVEHACLNHRGTKYSPASAAPGSLYVRIHKMSLDKRVLVGVVDDSNTSQSLDFIFVYKSPDAIKDGKTYNLVCFESDFDILHNSARFYLDRGKGFIITKGSFYVTSGLLGSQRIGPDTCLSWHLENLCDKQYRKSELWLSSAVVGLGGTNQTYSLKEIASLLLATYGQTATVINAEILDHPDAKEHSRQLNQTTRLHYVNLLSHISGICGDVSFEYYPKGGYTNDSGDTRIDSALDLHLRNQISYAHYWDDVNEEPLGFAFPLIFRFKDGFTVLDSLPQAL